MTDLRGYLHLTLFCSVNAILAIASRTRLAHCSRPGADQLAAALCFAALYRHWHAVDSESFVGSDDLVDSMWFPGRVELWAADFIAEPGNCASLDVMIRGAANDGSTMIGFVSDSDYS